MGVASWPYVPKKLQQTNRQDPVCIQPAETLTALFSPGWITSGSASFFFFCRLLLLFKIQNQYKDQQ
jgi:hypothetical protein